MSKSIDLEIGFKQKKISDKEFYTIYNGAIPKQLFPINPTYKIIHVHIPKTAGTSIREALFGSNAIKHVKAKEINLSLWEALPSITIIRDPLERFISSYKYHVKGQYRGVLFKNNPKLHSLTIGEYAETYLGKCQLLETQKSFISRTDSNKKIVDYIIRFDSISKEIPELFKKLEIPVKIGHLKVSKKIEIEVPDKVIEIVKEYYKEDYELVN